MVDFDAYRRVWCRSGRLGQHNVGLVLGDLSLGGRRIRIPFRAACVFDGVLPLCACTDARRTEMLARPFHEFWQTGFSELACPKLRNKLRRIAKLANMAPVDLGHIHITV